MRKLMEMIDLDESVGGLLSKLRDIVSRHNNNQMWSEDGYYALLDELQSLIEDAEHIPNNNHDLPMFLRTQAD